MITLDFSKRQSLKVWAKEYDTARELNVQCIKDYVPIDITNCIITLNALKKDGTYIYNNGEIQDATNGKVTFPMTNQLLAVVGEVKADVSIYYPNDTVITSSSFTFDVDETIRNDEAIESANEFTELTKAIAAEANRMLAESNRVSAEQTRVNNENARCNAESTRANNESNRISAETNRVSAENSRVTEESERVTAEQGRADAEISRALAESLRVNAETARVDAETLRVEAEDSRAAAETARQIGYATMDARINSLSETNVALSAQLAEIANQVDGNTSSLAAIRAAGTASPAGTYADLAALIAANPDHSKIYITLDDGNWCYHNGTAFVAGGVYQATALETDKTLTVSGAAADAKVTGDKVSELKSAIDKIEDEQSITDLLTEIAYINNNIITYWHAGAWGVVYFACEPNTEYKITKTQGNKFLCGWISEEPATNVAVNNYTDFGSATSAKYTTGGGAKYVLVQATNTATASNLATIVASMSVSYIFGAKDNVVRNAVSTLSETISEIVQDVERNTEAIDATIETNSYTEYSTIDIVPVFTDGYCDQTTGDTSSSYGDIWHYTQMITVQSGDVIKAVPLSEFRKISAFNNGVIVPSAGKDGGKETTYTVPNGVNGLRITMVKNRNTTGFTINRQENNTSYIVKQNKLGYMATSGNLSDGESLTLPVTNVKNHIVFTFSANVTTFGSIEIGKGTAKIVIDDTNIEVYSQGSLLNTYPHGLTFGNRVQIIIEKETGKMFSLARIVGDGVAYSITNNTTFYTDEGAPFVTSDGSTLTDCVFSFTSRHINKPIWLFGDSYFSYAWDDPHAWTWYLIQDGYIDSCLLNAYAGETSKAAYNSLTNLLSVTTPKMVVWCLGMNDPDNTSTWVGEVNPSWKQIYDKVIDLSKKYGFELVLYTTPTTPTMDNSYKNAIIRDSANIYRYVDADKAVRIDAEGHWVGYGTDNPALATDNVHPTSLGAMIIYQQFLADLPELTSR